MISIQINQLSKAPILKNIHFRINSGDLVVIIGSSGCGKTTLLKCLNGLEMFHGGSIEIDGKAYTDQSSPADLHRLRQNFGMVFQSFNLFPHLTILENLITAPVVVQKKSREQAIDVAQKLLQKVGLGHLADRKPHALSGGQQQRAAIARALAMQPSCMLYDEPTSALDPRLVDEVLQVMRDLDQEGMTQIIVTHDMQFAKSAADTVIYMDHGEIIEAGAPEELFSNPKDPRTRAFLQLSTEIV